jgi:Spy/CpxP family protein refolding chaperone
MAMNILKNNRTVFWILIFLVLINITALATYFVYSRKTASQQVPVTEVRRGFALRQELSLTPAQSLEVNKVNAAYQASSEPIVQNIREMKAGLLEELSKENTDSMVVIKIANAIVNEQEKLQKANIKQFLDLKKVCTPEQTQKLSNIYAELYGCDNKGKGRGQGNGNGYRHRYGQKQGALKR